MPQPRLPSSVQWAEGRSLSVSDSPSGLWPLGRIARATLVGGSINGQAYPAEHSPHDSSDALASQLRTQPDPVGLLAKLFAHAPVGLAVWKRDGHVLLANDALARLFGNAPPPTYNLFADGVAAELGLTAAVQRAFAGEATTLPTFWYGPRDFVNGKGMQRWRAAVTVAVFPIMDAAGPVEYVAAVYRDDTHLLRAHEQLKAQSDELERHIIGRTAELEAANEELEAFSYSVSHDLRAPVRAIDAFATLLLEDPDSQLSARGVEYLHRIRAASTRMSELINGLLSFARLGRQSLQVQSVDTAHLVEEVLQDLRSRPGALQANIVVEPLPPCRADANLLREVFVNLLDNAIKFTGKNPAPRIDVGTRVQDGQVVWYVADNGVGFDMAHYERLFGVFSRLHSDEEFEGTGVGLALVSRIIKRHGGEIWAYAEPGKGATFYFTLGQ